MYSTKSVGLGFAVFSAVTFGGSGPFAKALIGAGFTPEQAAWLRILGAAALLIPLVLIFRGASGLRAARSSWRMLVLYGLTGIAGCQTLFFIAASRLPVGVALMLEFTGPVLVVAWLKFGQKIAVPRTAAVGVGIALIGLATVVEIWSGLTARPGRPDRRTRRGRVPGDVLHPDRQADRCRGSAGDDRGRQRGRCGGADRDLRAVGYPVARAGRHDRDRRPLRARLGAGRLADRRQHGRRLPRRRGRGAAAVRRDRRCGRVRRGRCREHLRLDPAERDAAHQPDHRRRDRPGRRLRRPVLGRQGRAARDPRLGFAPDAGSGGGLAPYRTTGSGPPSSHGGHARGSRGSAASSRLPTRPSVRCSSPQRVHQLARQTRGSRAGTRSRSGRGTCGSARG